MRRATAYTLVAAVLWGTTFPAIRYGLEGGIGPITFAALRFALATLLLLGLLAALRRLGGVPWRSPALWGLGALNAVGYATQFWAQDLTTASKTSLLVDINVVAVAALGYWWLRERHGRDVILALGLGLAGVWLLATGGDPGAARFDNGQFVGDVLALAAGLVWAVYFVGLKRFLEHRPGTDGLGLTVAILAFTTLLLVPAASLSESLSPLGDVRSWAMVAYLATLPTGLAFWLWQEALRTEAATTTALLLLLEIVVAVGLSVAFLHERLSPWAMVGAGLIVIACLLASRAPSATAEMPPAPASLQVRQT